VRAGADGGIERGSALMTSRWQLVLCWGVLSGLSTGCVAVVLGATIVNRWFVKHRGVVMGAMTASAATGTLIFLPGAGGDCPASRLAAGGADGRQLRSWR
jgi:MFS family permease